MRRFRLSGEDRVSYLNRLLDLQQQRTGSMSEQDTKTPARGTYDHIRCGCCGHGWESHPANCFNQRNCPEWPKWLKANPDPRIEDTTVALGISAKEGSQLREYADSIVFEWAKQARAASVPDHLIGKVPERNGLANGTAH